jgi:hypothetical protein
MKIVSFQDEHAGLWDEFCLRHDRAWFWHTTYRMRHALACSFSIRSENRSFWIEDNGRPAAIVPLTVDDHSAPDGTSLRQMSYGGSRVPAPVVDAPPGSARAGRLYKLAFEEIDRRATEAGAKVALMRLALSPAAAACEPGHNFLTKYGYLDVSLNTQIVPLAPSEEDIFEGFQSNHQRAIRKAEKLLEIRLYDRKNITPEIFARFQEFYFTAAGRVTRPPQTFELLRGYLESGRAVLGEALYEDRPVGYAATIIFKDSAYYLMGAADKDFGLCPTAHPIHWQILRYLKSAGIGFYEMGIQQYGPLLHDFPSEKEINISRFKRGFGGVTAPAFMGEKYYCPDYFREVAAERARRYEAALRGAQPGEISR